MKTQELRHLSLDDLKEKINSLKENLCRLRCNKVIGQLEDTSTIKNDRRNIARAMTILNEKLIAEKK